jgi:hypothetical protein
MKQAWLFSLFLSFFAVTGGLQAQAPAKAAGDQALVRYTHY